MRSLIFAIFLFCPLTLIQTKAWAWGAKGHYVICEAAIHLVTNKNLKSYLLHKTHHMGHLCNIPDIYWRQIPNTESGNSTHFFEPDAVGAKLEDIPLSFAEVTKTYRGKKDLQGKTIFSVEKEIGSLWWRSDQFIRLAIKAGQAAKRQNPPEPKDEKNDDHPYNKSIFEMLTFMGLLGHFVGDAAQPLHNTTNYDGWDNGHGGIHGYYEENIVVHLDPNLLKEIILAAKKSKADLDLSTKSSPIEKMKRHSILAKKDLEQLWKLDLLEKASVLTEEKGMSIKKSAKRPHPEKLAKKFAPMIIKQMSRAAVLLANFWDEIYTKANEPNLETYKGYRFPLQPDFVEPDYY